MSTINIGHIFRLFLIFLMIWNLTFAADEYDWITTDRRINCYYQRGAIPNKIAEHWQLINYQYWMYWDWNGKGPKDQNDTQCWRETWDDHRPPLCNRTLTERCLVRVDCSYYPVFESAMECLEYPPCLDDGHFYFWRRDSAEPMWKRNRFGDWFSFMTLSGGGWIRRTKIPPLCTEFGGQSNCLIQVGSEEYRLWPRT